ncbi:stc1 protein [Fusarium langsethiae]|uniref:Stc1 protein n=1 Tax=Fusarium langsethiae TaxID=179993 RepID=A0A0N0V6J1_FUSLA|nr:stc1 protein [Fusarium langsethiae]GKU02228.1 unnamed protein product [Fusarium langsethiae]
MPKANEYRCSTGGEWKDLAAFSKSQQKRAKLGNRENSGMICMEHSQPVRCEITCVVCNRDRPIEEYSHNERKSDDPRCQQCVAWDTEQEYGVVPIPLATGHHSVEEPKLKEYSAPTNTADFFEPETIPGAPITGPEGLGLQPTESVARAFSQVVGNAETSARVTTVSCSETSSIANENKSTTSSHLPPHLRGRIANDALSVTSSRDTDVSPHLQALLGKMVIDGGSLAESSNGMASHTVVGMKLPPHLQGRKKPEQSSEARTPGMDGSTTGSISTATTLRKDQEEITASRKINFNAWDSKGIQHRAIKNPTVASSSASVVSSSGKTDQDSNLIGDWDDIPVAPMPQTRGNSK